MVTVGRRPMDAGRAARHLGNAHVTWHGQHVATDHHGALAVPRLALIAEAAYAHSVGLVNEKGEIFLNNLLFFSIYFLCLWRKGRKKVE